MGKGAEPKNTEVLPSGVRDFSPVAVAQGTWVHPADRTQLLGQRTQKGQVPGGEGPGCVFPVWERGDSEPSHAELGWTRGGRSGKHLSPCRALDAGLCCVKSRGGSFGVPSRQSPCPFAENGPLCSRGGCLDVLHQT